MSQSRILVRLKALTLALALVLGTGAAVAEPHSATSAPAGVAKASVKLDGEGLAAIELTAEELAALPHVSVGAVDHGETSRFEGVALSGCCSSGLGALGGAAARGQDESGAGGRRRRRLPGGLRAGRARPGLYRQGGDPRRPPRRQADERQGRPAARRRRRRSASRAGCARSPRSPSWPSSNVSPPR